MPMLDAPTMLTAAALLFGGAGAWSWSRHRGALQLQERTWLMVAGIFGLTAFLLR